MGMFETGAARRSAAQPDPIEHLLVRVGSEWRTWCWGSPAVRGFVSLTRRRCPRCMALARADLKENGAPDEPSEFDWYLGRRVVKP